MGAQILMAVLMGLGLGVGLAKHGEAREPHNFFVDVASFVIMVLILWWGGFWDVWLK